ncbi:hypothetical protein D9756_002188 [Leucocoprinus leucothites]|uniref:Wings apart-like protein C-terminal domain-containing protein n=1 Tax=Leucocoprinus leucothites TaxID=201217 RepID=A0A8H5GCC2_9AGAR|nr:hypothetical protein D9756_002188 [Leucoagaricus leucothites]
MPSAFSRTYGKKAPVKRKTTPSDDEETIDTKRRKVTPTEQDACLVKPKPKARTPSPSPTKTAQTATPTKMTKRMLGRSKTESSIDNNSSTSNLASRTSSLPTIPSPSSQPLPPPDIDRRPTLAASTSTPRVKRTYAGQSRSFLVALPVSDLPSTSTIPGIDGGSQEDEFYEPESYSSLRLRWGVDNSEDDPATSTLPPTPSRPNPKSKSKKSNSTNTTPASKKGKGKAPAPAVYLPPNMMNPLKSITELRSKGESRRFLDEVGYLFEGMDPSNSIGLKRSSASEITTKLCDDEFARNAKAADFYHKTWDVFLKAGAGRGQDKILDILLIFLLALITRDTDTLLDLATQGPSVSTTPDKSDSQLSALSKGKQKATHIDYPPDTLISILFFILKSSADVDPLYMISRSSSTDLDFKRIGLSKKDKLMLSTIYTIISTKSKLFSSDTPITTALLITRILTHLPPSLLPTPYLPDLLCSLRSVLYTSFSPNEPFDGTCPRRDDGSGVIDLSDDEETNGREPQYECIKHHLHLLDMYLLGQWSLSAEGGDATKAGNGVSTTELDRARAEWFVDNILAVGVCSEIRLRSSPSSSDHNTVSECLEILLRILLNLTHGDPNWAQSVISNEFAVSWVVRLILASSHKDKGEDIKVNVKVEENVDHQDITGGGGRPGSKKSSQQQHAWDRLCLALGLLTNLVQSVPEFKNVLRRTKVSPKCTSPTSVSRCTKQCTCPPASQLNALEVCVGVYNTYSPLSSRPPTAAPTKKILKQIKREPSPSPPPPSHSTPQSTTAINDTSLILNTLSILFGLLMSSSPQNQTIILSSINSPVDDERIKLERLTSQAKEFVLLCDDAGAGAVEETKSAKEVVGVLERLRDEC